MIVKLQLPLLAGDAALIFNQDKSFRREVAVTRILCAKLGGRRSGYFRAEINEADNAFDIHDPVPDPGW